MSLFGHMKPQFTVNLPSIEGRSNDEYFGEAIFGNSPAFIKNFLQQQGQINSSDKSLAKHIRSFVFDACKRKKYVNAAYAYLKNKSINLDKNYDIVLAGAGLHAAVFLYNLKKCNPNLTVLIIEKSAEICSTFAKLGDSLVLNSPTYGKVGLNANILQGHFIQASDFDELDEKPFPTAKHLHELATMIMFHADADILFDSQVNEIKKIANMYCVTLPNETVIAKNLIISNGMGEPTNHSFQKDKTSEKIIFGDEFICKCFEDKSFIDCIKDKKVAVVGDGDTANCVMEYLLPLVYPNSTYGFYRQGPFLPKRVYWIGQSAKNIQDYFYANKQRYCHSGGVIEFFWDGDTPFDLPTEIWKKTRPSIQCIKEKLISLSHSENDLILKTSSDEFEVDLVIDCTGRFNELSLKILAGGFEFVKGDITLYQG